MKASKKASKLSLQIMAFLRIVFLHLLMYILLITGIGHDDKQDPQANDPYVPKSKRWTKVNMVTAWGSRIVHSAVGCIEKYIQNMRTKARVRRAIRSIGRPSTMYHKLSRAQKGQKGRNRARQLTILVAIAISTDHTKTYQAMQFDTDSGPIGIDNRCTACISHKVQDFDGPLIEVGSSIRGFAGSKTTGVMKGTLTW